MPSAHFYWGGGGVAYQSEETAHPCCCLSLLQKGCRRFWMVSYPVGFVPNMQSAHRARTLPLDAQVVYRRSQTSHSPTSPANIERRSKVSSLPPSIPCVGLAGLLYWVHRRCVASNPLHCLLHGSMKTCTAASPTPSSGWGPNSTPPFAAFKTDADDWGELTAAPSAPSQSTSSAALGPPALPGHDDLWGPSAPAPGGAMGPSAMGPGGAMGPSAMGPGCAMGPSAMGPGCAMGPSAMGPSAMGPGCAMGPSAMGPSAMGPSAMGPGGAMGPSAMGPGGAMGPSAMGPSAMGPGGAMGPSAMGPSAMGPSGAMGPSAMGPGCAMGPTAFTPGMAMGSAPSGAMAGPSTNGGAMAAPVDSATLSEPYPPSAPPATATPTMPDLCPGAFSDTAVVEAGAADTGELCYHLIKQERWPHAARCILYDNVWPCDIRTVHLC